MMSSAAYSAPAPWHASQPTTRSITGPAGLSPVVWQPRHAAVARPAASKGRACAVARHAASCAGWQAPQRSLPIQSRAAAVASAGAATASAIIASPIAAERTAARAATARLPAWLLARRRLTARNLPCRGPPWYRIQVASAALTIGLTGGIASGKSAVAAELRRRGAAVIDADQLARQVVEPGQPALAEIAARFGADVLTAGGELDRKKLGAIVFADREARRDLERITHPRIAAAGQAEIARRAAAGARVVFYEAPLIVENNLHRALDALIVVSISPELQRQRLMQRDGSTAEEAAARIAAQLPLAEKLAVATWVIDNGGTPAELLVEIDRVVAAIEARAGGSITAPSAAPPS